MKKKLLAWLMCAVMLLGLAGAQAETADMPTITLWAGMSSNCPEETLHQGTIRDLLGINYTVEWTQGDFLTTLNMKINSNELPDICVFWNDTVAANALINSGLVQPVDAFVQDPEKYPNLAAIPAETLDYIRASTPDGQLWYLPGNYAIEVDDPWPGWTVDAWWVRKDLLAEAGMQLEDLNTLEGFEKFARSMFGKVTADGLPVQPISYSSESGYNIILNAFGIDTGAGKSGMPAVSLVNGEKVFLYDHPNLKNAYAWMNKMYREGLLDMEVTTQKNERLTEKMNSGEIGIYPGSAWAPGLNNAWYAMQTEADNVAAANLEPVKIPLAGGAEISFSSLLVCMMLGTIFCNLSEYSVDIMDRSSKWTAPLYAVFFVISGALMLSKPQESLGTLYKKRVLKYFLILLAFSVVYALSNALLLDTKYTVGSFLLALYSKGLKYHLWYLYAYLAYLMLLPLLKAMVQRLDDRFFIYMIALHVFFQALPMVEYILSKGSVSLQEDLRPVLPIWIFVLPCIGYYLEERVDIARARKWLPLLWAANIALIALTCWATYVRGVNVHEGVFTEGADQAFHNRLNLFNCLVVYLTIKCLFGKARAKRAFGRAVTMISQTVFGIYLIHPILKDTPMMQWLMTTLKSTGLPPLIACWLYVLAMFVVCCAIMLLVKWVRGKINLRGRR